MNEPRKKCPEDFIWYEGEELQTSRKPGTGTPWGLISQD